MQLNDALIADLSSRLSRVLDYSGPLPVPKEDLVAEVLLRLLMVDNSQEIRNPFAYARTILTNLVRDHIRKAERAQRAIDKLAAAQEHAAAGERESDSVADHELLSFLLEKTELTPTQDKVIRMIYLRGMNLSEVAKELSKNPGTILRHRDRALKKLEDAAAGLELDD